jgi:hypothetical protein
METAFKHSVLYFVSVILLFLAYSCNKNEPITGGHNHYDIDESLQPMLFNKGSQWIYVCKETGDIDTVRLVKIDLDTLGPYGVENGFTAAQQVYYLRYLSSLSGAFTHELVSHIITLGTVRGGYIYLAGKSTGEESMNALVADIHDTLMVGDQKYRDVVEMKISTDSYVKKNMILYYADSVGLIKQEILKNYLVDKTWILKEKSVLFY